jgi:hypothetical protein
MTQQALNSAQRRLHRNRCLKAVGGVARMGVDGAGRLLRQYAARAEGGRRDILGVLRIRWRGLSAGEAPHRSRIYRCPSEGRQEARDDTALVATISRVHTAAHLHNPCSSETVRLGLKKIGRETSARQDQAHRMNWKDIKEFIDSAGDGLRADRERAMRCVTY